MPPRTITIPENFDSANAFDFRGEVLEDMGSVIIDFRDTLFMDSAGIGTLVFWLRTLQRSGGELIFLNLSGQPKDIVKIVGLDKVVKIQD